LILTLLAYWRSLLDLGKKDWKATARDRITSRTRPAVTPEITTVSLPGSTDQAVLIIRIAESLEAPHEVLSSSTSEILVRRGDKTESAGLDDVERLIYRRDKARENAQEALAPEFFERRIAPDPSYDVMSQGIPPTVAVTVRPRRIATLRFDFDSELDNEMRQLASKYHLLDRPEALRPSPFGGVLLVYPDQNKPHTAVEVHSTGTILGAKALSVSEREVMTSERGIYKERDLDFGDLTDSLLNMIRFAAAAYALRRAGVEMEVSFGLSQCGNCRAVLAGESNGGQSTDTFSYEGRLPVIRPVLRSAMVKTEAGCVDEDDILLILREVSRFFQISARDDYLRQYLNGLD
jgi:hypothetical protein